MQTEQDLARAFPSHKISSTNSIPIPRLSQNPSRVDRLLIEEQREHAKVITLVCNMEQILNRELHSHIHDALQEWIQSVRNLQMKRADELSYSKIGVAGGDRDDYQVLVNEISLAISELSAKTRAARTALWCAFNTLING